MKVSRRKLLLAAAVTAAAQAPAQAPQTPASTTVQPADAELEAAKSQQRGRAQIIARVPLPMTTEPAFHFKA
jgi:hypothetical protein